MENNKIYATVDWYDEKKGFGMARNNSIPLLVHNYYFKDEKDFVLSNLGYCGLLSRRNTTQLGFRPVRNAE